MWRPYPINPSKYKIVRRLDLLVAIAKAMRGCHFYYANVADQTLYGVPEDLFCIRSMKLPPDLVLETSFIFRTDTVDMDVVSNYIDFVILDDMPWAAIPLIDVQEIKYYQPVFHPESKLKLWTVMKGRSEVDFIDLLAPQTEKSENLESVRAFISGYLNTRQFSINPIQFPHMERNLVIKKIFESKVSIGEQFLPLSYDDISYGVLMFRTMFPLNRADYLNITVNDRADNPDLFEVHYEIIHNKNPIEFIIPGNMVEYCHIAAVRLK